MGNMKYNEMVWNIIRDMDLRRMGEDSIKA